MSDNSNDKWIGIFKTYKTRVPKAITGQTKMSVFPNYATKTVEIYMEGYKVVINESLATEIYETVLKFSDKS